MNLWSRIQMFFNVKTTAALDRLEDPRETLAYGYTRQRELLREVKRGLVEVTTARNQLEQQAQKLRNQVPQLQEQAQRALAAGSEDLARLALQRKQGCLTELAKLEKQLADVAEEVRKLTEAERQCSQRLEMFRNRRDTLSAVYTAAEAQVQVNETLGSLSGQSAELGNAIERAEERISRMQARATALDSLIQSGSLTFWGNEDPIERELSEMSNQQAVEAELSQMKLALHSEPSPAPAQEQTTLATEYQKS